MIFDKVHKRSKMVKKFSLKSLQRKKIIHVDSYKNPSKNELFTELYTLSTYLTLKSAVYIAQNTNISFVKKL
jgi:hypothetical protein